MPNIFKVPITKGTMKEFEELLNNEYTPDDAIDMFTFEFHNETAERAMGLLNQGKFGTALRRYKPGIFHRQYLEWIGGKTHWETVVNGKPKRIPAPKNIDSYLDRGMTVAKITTSIENGVEKTQVTTYSPLTRQQARERAAKAGLPFS